MSKMQREKGHNFERRIAAELRAIWPGADVHRSSQAERAREPDVVIAGAAPTLAKLLWLECQDARQPTPLTKLHQAECDIVARALIDRERRSPVVVWHKYLGHAVCVTTRWWVLDELVLRTRCPAYRALPSDMVVTVDWAEFSFLLTRLPMPKEAA